MNTSDLQICVMPSIAFDFADEETLSPSFLIDLIPVLSAWINLEIRVLLCLVKGNVCAEVVNILLRPRPAAMPVNKIQLSVGGRREIYVTLS